MQRRGGASPPTRVVGSPHEISLLIKRLEVFFLRPPRRRRQTKPDWRAGAGGCGRPCLPACHATSHPILAIQIPSLGHRPGRDFAGRDGMGWNWFYYRAVGWEISIIVFMIFDSFCLSNYSWVFYCVIIPPQPKGLCIWDAPHASLGALRPRPIGLRPSGTQGGPWGILNP